MERQELRVGFEASARRAGMRVIAVSRVTLTSASKQLFEQRILGFEESPARYLATPTVREQYPSLFSCLDARIVETPSEEVTTQAVGLCVAMLGIAETGSVLLAGEQVQERFVWLGPRRVIVLLPETGIVATLEDGLYWFTQHRETGAVTLLTGPSRTSDVERILTVGVQGAEEVDVVLLTSEEEGEVG
ncbi:MAG: LUD domain-containing protein [Chloroflexi bacterium]|nr:LUD domain-containing protein [Chloroflexota bacterium]